MNVISKGFDTIALHLPAEKGGKLKADLSPFLVRAAKISKK
jgi:hypothetical protein